MTLYTRFAAHIDAALNFNPVGGGGRRIPSATMASFNGSPADAGAQLNRRYRPRSWPPAFAREQKCIETRT
jgi:hypothetical protein